MLLGVVWKLIAAGLLVFKFSPLRLFKLFKFKEYPNPPHPEIDPGVVPDDVALQNWPELKMLIIFEVFRFFTPWLDPKLALEIELDACLKLFVLARKSA